MGSRGGVGPAASGGAAPPAIAAVDRSPRERLFAVDRTAAMRAAPSASAANEAGNGPRSGLFVALSRSAPTSSGN
jgi:hypothetical protein